MRAKDFGWIGLSVVLLVGILIIWLMRAAPSREPTRIQIQSAFSCQLEGNIPKQVVSFTVNQIIYICGRVSANFPEFSKQIQVRVYEGERETAEKPIYYQGMVLTSEDIVIPLDAHFEPGRYTVEISDGRIILSTIQMSVMN